MMKRMKMMRMIMNSVVFDDDEDDVDKCVCFDDYNDYYNDN